MSTAARSPSQPEPQPDFRFAYAAWVFALCAALGSLFFGEVMKLPPCTLCWYQRICLFPLVVILAAGILQRDPRLANYALPLTLIGLGIALYHNGVQLGWIPETLTPCTGTTSCSERQIAWFGFVTIPVMSASAFAAIAACLFGHHRAQRNSQA